MPLFFPKPMKAISTPGNFAQEVSGGRWHFAPHLRLIDDALCGLSHGSGHRLIVQLPPRHGKSELIGRYFPAWYLGSFPDKHVMYASYEARQARKYGRMARNVLLEFGQAYFGVSVATDASAADFWSLAGREGGMVTAGVGGPLTGKGAHLLIVDDPTKNSSEAESVVLRERLWDWWESTALTRLEPGGGVVLVQTRWHLDDLAGRALERQSGENWNILRLPALAEADDPLERREGDALWPARFDAAALARIRDNRELYWWLAMYQQRPSKQKQVEWPSEYFDGPDFWFDEWPELALRVLALDPSKGRNETADYSAFVLVGEDASGRLWVDANLERRSSGQIVADGVELCRAFRPLVLGIEGNVWQGLLGDMFEPEFVAARLFDVFTVLLENHGSKLMRIRRLDPWLRARRMRFRRTPGAKLLVGQLREFPMDRHDDGPDALEMAMQLLAMVHDGELNRRDVRIERIRA